MTTSQVSIRFVGPQGDYSCYYEFDEKTKYLKVPPEVLVSLVKETEHYKEEYQKLRRRLKHNKARSHHNKKRIAYLDKKINNLETKTNSFYESLEAWSRK